MLSHLPKVTGLVSTCQGFQPRQSYCTAPAYYFNLGTGMFFGISGFLIRNEVGNHPFPLSPSVSLAACCLYTYLSCFSPREAHVTRSGLCLLNSDLTGVEICLRRS